MEKPKRKRRTKAEMKAARAQEAPAPSVKKRKRRTKAEMERARAKEARHKLRRILKSLRMHKVIPFLRYTIDHKSLINHLCLQKNIQYLNHYQSTRNDLVIKLLMFW